jgi:hypothetical protein
MEAIRFRIFEAFPRLVCAASTRAGGVSDPPYASLNLGFSSGDDPASVRENRRRFLEALGVPPGGIVVGGQVHGTRVRPVGPADRGRGALDPGTCIPDSDGLVTADPGVFLLTVSADCPLIAVLAPPDRGVALAHSGWRGVAGSMPVAAVEALARATGARPAEMVAAVGPAIGPCCYQVGDDVVARLPAAARPAARRDPGGDGKHRLDLALAIRRLLEGAGLRPERIETSPLCSCCGPDRFFSYRRDGALTGRIAMVAGIRQA